MKRSSRVLSALLCAVFLFPMLCGAQAQEAPRFEHWPEEVDFRDLTYDLSAADELLDQCIQAEQLAASPESAQAVVDCWLALEAAYDDWDTQCAICGVRYYQDFKAYEADYLASRSLSLQVYRACLMAVQALLASDYGTELAQAMGQELADSYRSAAVPTDRQIALSEEDNEQVADYWAALYGDYTYFYQGESWTLARLEDEADGLDAAAYLAIYSGLAQAKNQAAGATLLEMIPLRNQMAAACGYDTFPEYAYTETYGRDYTVADAQALHRLVKDYIVPVETAYLSYRYYDLDQTGLDRYAHADQEAKLDAVEPCMDQVSGELGELFRYMRKSHLCDIEASDTKLDVGFTVNLPSYHSAFLFNQPQGTYYDLKTVIHEFGHFSAFCLAPSDDFPVDVAEIHSQGLEMLFLPYAGELFGADGGTFACAQLSDLISAVVEGCLYDEFQIYLYSHPSLTLSEINQAFLELAQEYGYSPYPGLEYQWVDVSHTFESPLYYLSYATSALSALDLFLRSQEDYDAAVDTYLDLIAGSDGSGYRATVQAAGLSDVFQEESVAALAGALNEYLYTALYGLQDLAGHWALPEIGPLVSAGIMEGSGGAFQPDAPMSRAMLVTTLYRLVGEPKPTVKQPVFPDVPVWTWYSDAVAWAYESGLAEGTGGGFDPNGPLTRESMAVLLCRFSALLELDASGGSLSGFPDADSVSPWAANAVGWAVKAGVIRGADGRLNPSGGTSRAEAAAMLYRFLTLEG